MEAFDDTRKNLLQKFRIWDFGTITFTLGTGYGQTRTILKAITANKMGSPRTLYPGNLEGKTVLDMGCNAGFFL